MKRRNDGIDVHGKSPCFTFYPTDFERDVQMLSLSAQGLWMRMMCWMHFCTHRGYLELPTGAPMTNDDIAAKVGKALREIERSLGEMERVGLFSRDERGCIFSRRMVRDTDISEKRKAAAAAGLPERGRDFAGRFAGANHQQKSDSAETLLDVCSQGCNQQNTALSLSPSSSSSFSPSGLVETHTATDTPIDSPAAENDSEKTVKPSPVTDPDWFDFRKAAENYGMQCSEIEWNQAYSWEWSKLDFTQRAAATKGITDRIEAQDFNLAASTPKNYLHDQKWLRAIFRPRRDNGMSRAGGSALVRRLAAQLKQGGAA